LSEAAVAKPDFGERALIAALLLLLAAVWLEPRGSGLAEPDETRYAEIPREMLAAGDLVVPRLDGVPYFEKPPLLYWANAASLALFGQTPWAARLPTRLAGLGTVLLVLWAAGARGGRRAGLSAAVWFLAAPMGFLFSRTNLTDGLFTFFFTAALLSGREAVLRREAARAWRLAAALAGAAAAGAFLTKGLAGVVLPGAILLLFCLATRRSAALIRALLLSPAPIAFVALSAPWFFLVARRHPGFLEFFFVHEHLARFATAAARRPGPITYFVPVFLLGFLPGIPFFVASLRRRRDDDALFALVWFAVVFVFFSISRSKLPPYLFPAIPAAALLAAAGRDAAGPRARSLWIVSALGATALVAGALATPGVRAAIGESRLWGIALPAFALLLTAAWAAPALASRRGDVALAAAGVGWAIAFAGIALAWPRTPQARFTGELADAARSAALPNRAPIVAYRDYLNGVSWHLRAPIPVVDYRGELEPEFEPRPEVKEALFWSREKFWATWGGGRPVVAVVRMRDLIEMMTAAPPARVVRWSLKHAVVANFDER
jgi:4-amino-4-deoxy-L-arabinose transferase-like glycosyltransferase